MFNLKVAFIAILLIVNSMIVSADGYLDRLPNNMMNNQISNNKVLNIKEEEIRIRVKYPSSVRAGEYFIVEASMSNNVGYARMGGLTLSFPQMTSVSGNIVSKTFDRVTGYDPHSKIYNKYLKKTMRSNYFMIEGWETKWNEGIEKRVKLKLKAPYIKGRFRVNVRGVLHTGSKRDRYEITIPKYGEEDQQGYSCKHFFINIQ